MTKVYLRKYTLMRITDDRLDVVDRFKPSDMPVPIYHFMMDPEKQEEIVRIGEQQRLDSWVLDQHEARNIIWTRKDPAYWKNLFKRAEEETFIPGMNVPQRDWQGLLTEKDNVELYWSRLARALPTGDRNDHRMWGFKLVGGRSEWIPYGHPRTHAHWLRILRFWIRQEVSLLEAGVRRELADYPKEVQDGLELAIDLMTKDLDCVDNIRFAETRKPGEMRRFKRAADNGCCGSTDRYVIIGRTQYIIGCNYGH